MSGTLQLNQPGKEENSSREAVRWFLRRVVGFFDEDVHLLQGIIKMKYVFLVPFFKEV
jgi:hypothetical protein